MDNYLQHILEKKPDLIFPAKLGEGSKRIEILNEDYHQIHNRVSNSLLSNMRDSPRKYLYELYQNQIADEKEEKKHLRFGRLFHEALLEPENFHKKKIVVKDFPPQRSKAAKEEKRLFLEGLEPGTIVFSGEEYDAFVWMLNSLVDHDVGKNIFKGGTPEVTFLFDDPKTGISARSRLDYIIPEKKWIVEVKTTRVSNPAMFKAEVYKMDYDMQLAFQAEAYKSHYGIYPELRVIVGVSKAAPHEIKILMLDDEMVSPGQMKYRWCMETLNKCLELKQFPPKQIRAEIVSPPSWAAYETFPEIEFKE